MEGLPVSFVFSSNFLFLFSENRLTGQKKCVKIQTMFVSHPGEILIWKGKKEQYVPNRKKRGTSAYRDPL